jgi:hypothetical protein
VSARPRAGLSKIRLSSDGPKFLLIILRIITIFSPLRVFVPVAAASFAIGAGYGLYTSLTRRDVTDSAVLLVMLAVIVLLVGLVSEQISAMRFDERR